eukprot:m.278482 g.278482  ORF g.278482 m.278482 type:complete len:489 (-) comp11101_c0_seq98:3656-5122(-)
MAIAEVSASQILSVEVDPTGESIVAQFIESNGNFSVSVPDIIERLSVASAGAGIFVPTSSAADRAEGESGSLFLTAMQEEVCLPPCQIVASSEYGSPCVAPMQDCGLEACLKHCPPGYELHINTGKSVCRDAVTFSGFAQADAFCRRRNDPPYRIEVDNLEIFENALSTHEQEPGVRLVYLGQVKAFDAEFGSDVRCTIEHDNYETFDDLYRPLASKNFSARSSPKRPGTAPATTAAPASTAQSTSTWAADTTPITPVHDEDLPKLAQKEFFYLDPTTRHLYMRWIPSFEDTVLRGLPNVILRCTDTGSEPMSTTQSFAVQVLDEHEAPTHLVLSEGDVKGSLGTGASATVTLPENTAPGSIVFTYTVVDEDINNNHSVSLLDSAGGRFVLDEEKSHVRLASFGEEAPRIDYETTQDHRYELRLRVLDLAAGRPALEHQSTVIVHLTDSNDPPSIQLAGLSHCPIEGNLQRLANVSQALMSLTSVLCF